MKILAIILAFTAYADTVKAQSYVPDIDGKRWILMHRTVKPGGNPDTAIGDYYSEGVGAMVSTSAKGCSVGQGQFFAWVPGAPNHLLVGWIAEGPRVTDKLAVMLCAHQLFSKEMK